jgi:UDP-galactopyranose mutase
MDRTYDWLIVGAGFTGAIIAEQLASRCNSHVLVIDRRDHIAGNAYDRRNASGVLYHQYGPHIFHTSSEEVIKYLSRFTEWQEYEHRVVGLIDGRFVPVPFNLTSLEILFPQSEAKILKELLIDTYGLNVKVPILEMKKSPDARIQKIAHFIYSNVFLGYTTKQWGLTPEELSPSVTERVPIHISYDDRYFQDTFQQMPKEGYTQLFTNILNNPNITVLLHTDYNDVKDSVRYDRLLYTGMIDEFFGYVLGELPYRSLQFEFQTYQQRRHQPVGQVNYPVSHDFTRISEMSHFTQEWGDVTTVAIEYPKPHIIGKTVPYYPIPRMSNDVLYKKYRKLAEKETPEVLFAGRLGDYTYYDMDETVENALLLVERIITNTDN